MTLDARAHIQCSNCGREIDECWVCESPECEQPLCYRCVREGVETSLDPVAGPTRPS